jgi:hypothetical protein
MNITVGVEKLPSNASNVVQAYVLLNTNEILPNPLVAINDSQVFNQIYSTLGISPNDWFLSQITLTQVTEPFTALYAYSFGIRLVKIGTKDPEANQFQGPVGPKGLKGVKGDPGVQGVRGSTGPQGSTGPFGGPPGPPGVTGLPGPMGSQGPTGPRGFQGSPGQTGPVGGQGPTGARGIQGIQGIIGPTGPLGPTGAGVAGPLGPTGPAGKGFAPGGSLRNDLMIAAGITTASGFVIAGGQALNPIDYQLSGATTIIRASAIALKDNTAGGTGSVTIRNISDSTTVAVIPIGSNSKSKFVSSTLSLPSSQKIYEIIVDRGTAVGIGVAYVGFEIDRHF